MARYVFGKAVKRIADRVSWVRHIVWATETALAWLIWLFLRLIGFRFAGACGHDLDWLQENSEGGLVALEAAQRLRGGIPIVAADPLDGLEASTIVNMINP